MKSSEKYSIFLCNLSLRFLKGMLSKESKEFVTFSFQIFIMILSSANAHVNEEVLRSIIDRIPLNWIYNCYSDNEHNDVAKMFNDIMTGEGVLYETTAPIFKTISDYLIKNLANYINIDKVDIFL